MYFPLEAEPDKTVSESYDQLRCHGRSWRVPYCSLVMEGDSVPVDWRVYTMSNTLEVVIAFSEVPRAVLQPVIKANMKLRLLLQARFRTKSSCS